jgi:hypothetical protein
MMAAAKQSEAKLLFQHLIGAKLGLVASLARPGGNITGFANFPVQLASKFARQGLAAVRDCRPRYVGSGVTSGHSKRATGYRVGPITEDDKYGGDAA